MSEQAHEPGASVEPKSSIRIARTAKGDPQFEVKVYEGATAEELDRMRGLAVAEYKALNDEFYGAAA